MEAILIICAMEGLLPGGHRLSLCFEKLKHLIQDTGMQRNGQVSHFSRHDVPVTVTCPSFSTAPKHEYKQGMA